MSTLESSNIFKYRDTTFVSPGYSTKEAILGTMYAGDFNGDGKIDFLRATLDNNQVASWSAVLNNDVTLTLPSIITGSSPNSPYAAHVVDINNDGKDEIIFAIGSTIFIYELNGYTFTLLTSFTTDTLGSTNNFLTTVDLNGDGQKEIVYGTNSTSTPPRYITFDNRLNKGLFVKTITDGLGNKSTFTYKTYVDNRMFSPSFPKPTSPLNLVRGPMRVVENLTTVNESNTLANISYTYKDCYALIAGRGFLGFKTVTSSNSVSGISSTSNFSFKIPDALGIYYTWLSSQYTYKGGLALSSETNSMKAMKLDSTAKSFVPIVVTSVSTDHVKGITTTKTIDTYSDTQGRVTKQTLSNQDGWKVETVLAYDDVPTGRSRLSSITTTRTKPGGGSYTSTESFGHADANFPFRVTSHTGQGITTNITAFNLYGSPTTTAIGGRSTSCIYDGYGRFVESSTDATGFTTTAHYRSTDGAKLWEEDPKHNRTVFQYTNSGSTLTSTVSVPSSSTSTTTLSWDNTYGSLYKVLSSVTNGNTVSTYFNALGQKVRVNSKGYLGADLYTIYTYNTDGTLASEAKTGFPTVSYSYDSYGRVKTVSDGQTINVSYSYSGLAVTTSNAVTGTTKTETYDDFGNLKEVNGTKGLIQYDYYPYGKVKQITANGVVTSMTYYDQGTNATLLQYELNDPDAGTTTYTYNSYGQLHTQKYNNNQTTITCEYDLDSKGGQLKSKSSGTDLLEEYKYYEDNGKNGLLKSITRNGITESYSYDSHYRIDSVKTVAASTTYTTINEYNNDNGQLTHTQYPTGLKVEYAYNIYGNLTSIYNDADKTAPLWEGKFMNDRQQWTEFNLGNGLTTKWGYDSKYMLSSIKTGVSGNESSIQNLGFSFNDKGQLVTRTDNSLSESFIYDNLNRLTTSTVLGQNPATVSYSTIGNITSTSLAGTYSYDAAKPHAVGSVTGTSAQGTQPSFVTSSTFTADNKIKEINNTTYKNAFTYGPSGNRFKVDRYESNNLTTSKLYVGNSEYILNSAGTEVTRRTFIYAPTGICAVWEKNGTNPAVFYYIHTDYLGSWLKITNQSKTVENTYSYDAWGRPRDPATWVLKPISITNALVDLNTMQPRFDRGYTGHEHMAGFGLINMNGRVYDPYLQRFLSPDPFVQSPGNSQSYNRYSYCLNNPLMYTDPSGYFEEPYYNWEFQDLSAGGSGGGYSTIAGYRMGVGMDGYRGTSRDTYAYQGDKYYDRVTGKVVTYETVKKNYIESHSVVSYHYVEHEKGIDAGGLYVSKGTYREIVKGSSEIITLNSEIPSGQEGKNAEFVSSLVGLGSTLIEESSRNGLLDAAKAVKDPSAGVVKAVGTGARYVGYVGMAASLAINVNAIYNNPTWGNYGRLGVNGLSIGVSVAFPGPGTLVGLGISTVDYAGGFDGFYNYLDGNQQLYNSTGTIMVPSAMGVPLFLKLK